MNRWFPLSYWLMAGLWMAASPAPTAGEVFFTGGMSVFMAGIAWLGLAIGGMGILLAFIGGIGGLIMGGISLFKARKLKRLFPDRRPGLRRVGLFLAWAGLTLSLAGLVGFLLVPK